jgi:hypothetical protein
MREERVIMKTHVKGVGVHERDTHRPVAWSKQSGARRRIAGCGDFDFF